MTFRRTLGIAALMIGVCSAAMAGNITIKATGFKNQTGKAIVYLWTSASGFPSKTEQASKQMVVDIPGAEITAVFENVAPGTYAISITHDENGNNKMDTGFMGKPKEGYGASGNPKNRFSAPAYDKCKFEVGADGTSIEIAMND